MSETKPFKLNPFVSHKVNDRNTKETNETVRISVILPESTEDKCPEFNYKDELVAAKSKSNVKNHSKHTNGLDPFNDDDDDVKRVAAEMEAKYGMGVAKKRKWRKDDYADIGMGYDESDSFIDNTDGYDEIVPKNVTTVLGGFYINSGALEFKTDEAVSSEESSTSEEDTPEKSYNNKRKIESSAESEDDTPTERNTVEVVKIIQPEKKPKLINNSNGMQKPIKKRLFGHEKLEQQMRKKRMVDNAKKTVSELLREKKIDLNMTTSSINSDNVEIEENSASPKENSKKPVTLASVDDVIESVINNATVQKVEHTDESSKESAPKSTPLAVKPAVNSSPSDAESNDGISIKPTEIVQLPENLPSDIISVIDSIKSAAACSTEGKVKFFTENVNSMLLNLERKCRCLGKHARMKVYEHLAPFVKCRKETLIKRAKNLCIAEEQKKIKVLIDRLKTSVGSMMPGIIENYEDECRAALQRKFSANSDQNTKNSRLPKRHFSWTEDLKKLLRDIVTLKRKCFINEGRQKDTLEALLIDFFKTEIQVIWPEGWITINSLLKYSNLIDLKKNIESTKKTIPLSTPEVNISPPPNISVTPTSSLPKNIPSNISVTTTPTIPISNNSALTITPVTTPPTNNLHKVNSSDVKVKHKHPVGDTVISKINSDISNVSKQSRTLPPADIVKTSSANISSMKYSAGASNPSQIVHNKEIDTILLDDIPKKKDEPEDLSSHATVDKHIENVIKEGLSRNNCQIIDLTDQPDVKKKPSIKSKPKYSYDYSDKVSKPKSESTEMLRVKSQEELTGSLALTQFISDSLNSDVNRFSKSNITKTSNSIINSISSVNNINNSTIDYSKTKTSSEGDDIQKVMEGLKVLQRMSSPVKSNEDARTSSPVSVIAFNKSFSQDACSKTSTPTPTHRSNSFQDAFQKHFIPDFMKASFAASTSKGNYNSFNKHNHSVTKSSPSSSEKFLQNSNNFSQQNPNKLKNNYASQQSGSYNMLDDMFANFLNEYGYSRTANSKSSTQHK